MTTFCFSKLLEEHGLLLRDVALVRHQKTVARRPTPYGLWVTDRRKFELFQSTQSYKNRSFFNRPFWASFVATPDGSTLFIGVYEAKLVGDAPPAHIDPLTGLKPGEDKAKDGQTSPYDLYETHISERLFSYIGRIKVDWGQGYRSWMQTAKQPGKVITELSTCFKEEAFPGPLRFLSNLSDLPSLPSGWIAALSSIRGIYLLTCPRTREQYVGKANGLLGFWGRWQSYIADGHGGNIGLKSRNLSDYQITILEVCGSAATNEEIDALEALWKQKLQSREMGLNKN
jgi:GIY-YIG catalytic domain